MSDGLLSACANVDGTAPDDVFHYFGIKTDDSREICERTTSFPARRLEALSLWKKRLGTAATVGRLLGWYEEMHVARRVIENEYKQCQGK